MAPIYNPNGNEVSEIVLPNGNTASEVIAPDGQQVFGAAIPDSAIHQYKINGGSGTTLTDSIGSNDLTTNGGPTWYDDGEAFKGDWALDFDGSDDEAVGDNIPECGGESAFSVAFTLDLNRTDTTDTGKNEIIHNMNTSSRDDSFGISFGNDGEFDSDIECDLRDNGSKAVLGVDMDGFSGKIRVVLTNDGALNAQFYVNTNTYTDTGANGNISANAQSMTFGSTNGDGYGDVALDNVIFYNSELTSQEIQDDYNAQPWT